MMASNSRILWDIERKTGQKAGRSPGPGRTTFKSLAEAVMPGPGHRKRAGSRDGPRRPPYYGQRGTCCAPDA